MRPRRISYPSEAPDNGERRHRGMETTGGGERERDGKKLSQRETRTSAPPPRNIIAPAPFPRADWKLSLPRNYLCSIARADISRKRGRVAARKLFDCVSQSGRNRRRNRESRTWDCTRTQRGQTLHTRVSVPFSLLFYFHELHCYDATRASLIMSHRESQRYPRVTEHFRAILAPFIFFLPFPEFHSPAITRRIFFAHLREYISR